MSRSSRIRFHDKDRQLKYQILRDNPDPFSPQLSTSSSHKYELNNKKRKYKFMNYNNNISSHYSKKRKKNQKKNTHYNTNHQSNIFSKYDGFSFYSSLSSDIEILSNNNYNNYNNNYSKKKSKKKFGYNIYADNSDNSNNNRNNKSSPIPFHMKQNRSYRYNNSYSTPKRKKSKRKEDDDCDSMYSRLSRRSKSRSPIRSSSPMSQNSSKLNDPTDLLLIRDIAEKGIKKMNKHKYRKNKQYSSLDNLPCGSSNNKTYIRKNKNKNTGGKHRKHLRKKNAKRKFHKLKKSILNDLPLNDNELITTDMGINAYQNLMNVSEKSKKRIKNVSNHLGADLANFVVETELRLNKNKIDIDLTNDNDIDLDYGKDDDDIFIVDKTGAGVIVLDDDDDIEILSQPKDKDMSLDVHLSVGSVDHSNQFTQHQINRMREQSYNKFQTDINDDLYSADKHGAAFNSKEQSTNQILKSIENWRRKQEEKRKKKEELERQKQLELAALAELEKKKLLLSSQNQLQLIRNQKLRKLESDEEDIIEKAFELSPHNIVGTHRGWNIEAKVKDLNTLEDGQWLNDEVINFYMALLQDRNNQSNINNNNNNSKQSNIIRVLLMNTFYYAKLSENSYTYKNVRRWTRKGKLKKKGIIGVNNVFEIDKLIFPVHVNNIHWCCGCVNFRDKKFEYYDSMSGSGNEFFKNMRKYLTDEWKDKLKSNRSVYDLNLNDWVNDGNRNKYPQQQNGVDCGVFTSKCADWISDDMYPDYSQSDMSYFRKRMMLEIINGNLLK